MKKLYFGGNIITMEKEHAQVEAVLIEDEKIVRTGTLHSFKDAQNDPEIKKIDLQGRTMLPGFIDPHSHISIVGMMDWMANLRMCTSFSEIITILKTYIANRPQDARNSVVIGFGYDHNFLEEHTHPTKEILNEVSKHIPILLLHISGHVGCCNDAALKVAEIDEMSIDPEGGTIGRVAETLEPNGYLEETALHQVQAVLYKDMVMDSVELFLEGQETYIRNGITTAQDGATSADMLNLLQSLNDAGKLKIDIVAYPPVEDVIGGMEIDEKYVRQYKNRLKVGGYKMFLDGSPQGKTAWLSEPYEGEATYRGYPRLDDATVNKFIQKAVDDQMQLLTHCNGDAASEQLIDQYKKVLYYTEEKGERYLRPVMIHCQTTRADQLHRMKDLEMIPSIFVGHTYFWGDVHIQNLGVIRGNYISPANTAFKEGLKVNFHQDSPVTAPDMLHTIWCAVNRQTRKGVTIGASERVTVYEALQAVTINAAYAYFEEDVKGTIETGKFADFVLLDQNPFDVDPMKLKDIKVIETIKHGESLYKTK